MPDSVSVHFQLGAWHRAVAEMHVLPDRAVMWALRESGRQVKREARLFVRHDTGQLSNSIHSSKRLKKTGPHKWQLNVGPHGKSHLYAKKIEAKAPFMGPAEREVAPKFRSIHEKAMARALAKYTA